MQSTELDDVIRHHVGALMHLADGRKLRVADLLGVSLKTLYNWLNRWELQGKPVPGPVALTDGAGI